LHIFPHISKEELFISPQLVFHFVHLFYLSTYSSLISASKYRVSSSAASFSFDVKLDLCPDSPFYKGFIYVLGALFPLRVHEFHNHLARFTKI